MALSGSVLQDGGEPAADFAEHVGTEGVERLVERFLLTQGYERKARASALRSFEETNRWKHEERASSST